MLDSDIDLGTISLNNKRDLHVETRKDPEADKIMTGLLRMPIYGSIGHDSLS